MIQMDSFYRFLVFLCFAGMIVGCEKRGRQELSKVMDKKLPLITSLPINDEVFSFNVGNGTVRYPPPDGTAEFFNKVQEVGSSLSKTNRMDLEYPYGHFLISENLQVIGLSLLPRLTYHDVMPLGLVGWPTDSKAGLSDVFGSVDNWPTMERNCRKISIRSVEPLSKLKELELIDFVYAGFEDGVWQSIAKLASNGSLRGLSMVRGADFLERRSDTVIPGITGLAVHVETVEQVAAFGQAFPNLSYVSLSMDGTNLIGEMMRQNTLNSAFPNLKALFIGGSTSMTAEEWLNGPARGNDRELRMDPSCFPESLEWLCVDGGLLSIREMQQYNDLGRKFRHHTPKGFKREVAHRDVEVVFFGMGFAGYARSIKEYEHHTMDRFWRKPRE